MQAMTHANAFSDEARAKETGWSLSRLLPSAIKRAFDLERRAELAAGQIAICACSESGFAESKLRAAWVCLGADAFERAMSQRCWEIGSSVEPTRGHDDAGFASLATPCEVASTVPAAEWRIRLLDLAPPERWRDRTLASQAWRWKPGAALEQIKARPKTVGVVLRLCDHASSLDAAAWAALLARFDDRLPLVPPEERLVCRALLDSGRRQAFDAWTEGRELAGSTPAVRSEPRPARL